MRWPSKRVRWPNKVRSGFGDIQHVNGSFSERNVHPTQILLLNNTLNIFARVLEKMTTEERQKEYDTLDEMYGKYFVMQQFFTKVDNIDEWLKQFTDEQFIPKKK